MLSKLFSFLGSGNQYSQMIWWFRRAIYLFIIWNTITLFPIANELWGEAPHILKNETQGIFRVLNLLSTEGLEYLYFPFSILLIGACVTGILGFYPRFTAIVVFFLTNNLIRKEMTITNGSHHLLLLMVFYLLFMDEKNTNPKVGQSELVEDLTIVQQEKEVFVLQSIKNSIKKYLKFLKQGFLILINYKLIKNLKMKR